MRIAVCGSHGVGKTTLARILAEELNLPLLSETARTAAEHMGFGDCTEIASAPVNARIAFQAHVWSLQEINEKLHSSGFVSDRSLYDVLAYMSYYRLPNDIRFYYKRELFRNQRYDKLIYCPIPDAKIQSDGFRFSDPVSQGIIDSHLYELLGDTHNLLELSRERELWVNEVLSALK